MTSFPMPTNKTRFVAKRSKQDLKDLNKEQRW